VKTLSCGVLLLNDPGVILLCHVTGGKHWDIPKGNLDEGESEVQCAVRELQEETSIVLEEKDLKDLGRFDYTKGKDLHLFEACYYNVELADCHCVSLFEHAASKKMFPELDDYKWVGRKQIIDHCTINLQRLLLSLSW
jgi:8-oxo-dGTP pyrophosphatase MutT (NUDIX family)